ncbi:MAG TPA: helix-turn-helix domain-containing protein [Rhodanobacteraceae bacterium]
MTQPKTDLRDPAAYLRPAEACAFARCGRTFLYKATKRGKLHALRPSRRLTLYRRDELEKLIESSAAETEAAA